MADDVLIDVETGEIDEQAVLAVVTAEMTDVAYLSDSPEGKTRQRNISAYLGELYGNEKENYSSYVDRSVYETVESLLPYFMKVFHGTDQAVTFNAPASEDPQEQAQLIKDAREATDYINHIYNVDNDGYAITQTVIRDAAVQDVGWWKHYWTEERKSETKRFTGLTFEQVQMLGSQQGADVSVEVTDEETDPQTGQLVYDVRVTRQVEHGRIVVEAVPGSQMVYARRSKDIDECPFIAQVQLLTRSDLIEEGYDREKVESIPIYGTADYNWREGRYQRNVNRETQRRTDRAMEEVEVAECYTRLDLDNDGIAEWVRVVVAGHSAGTAGGVVLEVEECDGHPFTPISLIPLGHQIGGLGIADVTEDIQRLRSEMMRQMVDGLFLTNHPRWWHLKDKVDLDALEGGGPGESVELKSPDAVGRLDQRWEGARALPFMQEIDRITERRAGVSPHGTVQAASSMTKHAEGTVDNIMQASMARQELMARNLAESGFTRLYRALLKLAMQHQDARRTIRQGDALLKVDPRNWSPEMDVEVNAGIGVGRNQIRVQTLRLLLQEVKDLKQRGFRGIGEEQIYNLFADLLKAADMPAIDPYCQDVTKMDPPKPLPPPDPTKDIVFLVEKMKQEMQTMREQIKAGLKREELDQELAIAAEKAGSEEAIRLTEQLKQDNEAEPQQVQSAGEGTPTPPQPVTPPGAVAPPAETFFNSGDA